MRSTTVTFLTSLVVLAVGIGKANAQSSNNRIQVEIPYQVAVADSVLDPAKFEIREVSDRVLQLFDKDHLKVEATVFTIPTFDRKPAAETLVQLRKYRDNEY
jgi:hypothetical protein